MPSDTSTKGQKSAYAKHQDWLKKEPVRKRKHKKEAMSLIVKCGSKTKNTSGTCKLPAGFGTVHLGVGACKFHGGSTPAHVGKHAKGELAKLMGEPIEMNPLDAILWCIRITAGEVQWLSVKMAELEEDSFTEISDSGRHLHLWARERKDATDRLVRYSNIAVQLGLAERAVKLAESYGLMLARLIRGILDDLQLSPEQEAGREAIIRARMIEIANVSEDVKMLNPAVPTIVDARADDIEATATRKKRSR